MRETDVFRACIREFHVSNSFGINRFRREAVEEFLMSLYTERALFYVPRLKQQTVYGLPPPEYRTNVHYQSLCDAVNCLHTLNFFHRFINDKTVFVDESGKCILGDFRTCRLYERGRSNTILNKATFFNECAHPYLFSRDDYGLYVDLYSIEKLFSKPPTRFKTAKISFPYIKTANVADLDVDVPSDSVGQKRLVNLFYKYLKNEEMSNPVWLTYFASLILDKEPIVLRLETDNNWPTPPDCDNVEVYHNKLAKVAYGLMVSQHSDYGLNSLRSEAIRIFLLKTIPLLNVPSNRFLPWKIQSHLITDTHRKTLKEAVSKIHELGFMHRFINDESVLVDQKRSVLTDFRFCCIWYEDRCNTILSKDFKRTEFMIDEMFTTGKYDQRVDYHPVRLLCGDDGWNPVLPQIQEMPVFPDPTIDNIIGLKETTSFPNWVFAFAELISKKTRHPSMFDCCRIASLLVCGSFNSLSFVTVPPILSEKSTKWIYKKGIKAFYKMIGRSSKRDTLSSLSRSNKKSQQHTVLREGDAPVKVTKI